MGGTGGTMAGAAGAGSACGLPLESGPCNALFYAFGFDPMRGHCVRFPYGGCQGNENNFATLAECEAACGGSNVGACPERRPELGTMCEAPMLPCVYHYRDACLCADSIPYNCSKVDPSCEVILRDLPPDDACSGDDCTAEIRVENHFCECESDNLWHCSLLTP